MCSRRFSPDSSRAGAANDWRWVMSGPSVVLVVDRPDLRGGARLASGDRRRTSTAVRRTLARGARRGLARCRAPLATARRFWIVCALSFTLTLAARDVQHVDRRLLHGRAAAPQCSSRNRGVSLDAIRRVWAPWASCTLGWLFGRIGQRGTNKRCSSAMLSAPRRS